MNCDTFIRDRFSGDVGAYMLRNIIGRHLRVILTIAVVWAFSMTSDQDVHAERTSSTIGDIAEAERFVAEVFHVSEAENLRMHFRLPMRVWRSLRDEGDRVSSGVEQFGLVAQESRDEDKRILALWGLYSGRIYLSDHHSVDQIEELGRRLLPDCSVDRPIEMLLSAMIAGEFPSVVPKDQAIRELVGVLDKASGEKMVFYYQSMSSIFVSERELALWYSALLVEMVFSTQEPDSICALIDSLQGDVDFADGVKTVLIDTVYRSASVVFAFDFAGAGLDPREVGRPEHLDSDSAFRLKLLRFRVILDAFLGGEAASTRRIAWRNILLAQQDGAVLAKIRPHWDWMVRSVLFYCGESKMPVRGNFYAGSGTSRVVERYELFWIWFVASEDERSWSLRDEFDLDVPQSKFD